MDDDTNKTRKWPQFMAAIFICIGAWGTGTVIGWTANLTEELKRKELNDVTVDLMLTGSMMCLGAVLICVPIGMIADWIGRKPTCLSTVIPFTIGWALIIWSKCDWMVYVGRVCTGAGGGAFCIIAPMYTSEIAESKIRGTLGSFFQLFVTIGILYAYGLGMTDIKKSCYFCAIVPIIFFVLFLTQPETPVYLIKREKDEKAAKSLKRFRGPTYDCSKELAAIKADLESRKSLKKDFWPSLKSKAGKHSSLVCFMLMFFQQLSGINAVMFYAGDIYKQAGSSIDPKIATIVTGAVQVVATVASTFAIDVLGRKILLIASAGFMGFSTLLLGIYFQLGEDIQKKCGWLPMTSLIIFIIAFSFGLGPVPWVASSEMFPAAIKAPMSSLAGMFNWFLALGVTILYGPISNALKNYTTFYIFTVSNIACVFFTWLIMPETKGKTFEEIQAELTEKPYVITSMT